MNGPRVVCIGVHLLDVLIRPSQDPAPHPGRQLLDGFRITAAGTAAGPAVDLAKLGAAPIGIGVLGDDYEGDQVVELMRGHGVDVSRLVRASGQPTHVSVLFIGPDGERNPIMTRRPGERQLTLDDIDFEAIAAADFLHMGGADVLGDFGGGPMAEVMRFANERGVTTTLDLLARCDADTAERLAPALRETHYFFPNEEQLSGLTGSEDPVAAAQALRGMGVGHVVATLGKRGSLVNGPGLEARIPAFEVDLVDTTGCGDAYVAGFIVALANGWDPEAAGWLGSAAAGLVATGLGSDAGIVDLGSTIEFMATQAPARVVELARSGATEGAQPR